MQLPARPAGSSSWTSEPSSALQHVARGRERGTSSHSKSGPPMPLNPSHRSMHQVYVLWRDVLVVVASGLRAVQLILLLATAGNRQ